MNGFKILKAQIASELKNLWGLVEEAADITQREESNINVRAGGSILHDFYSGVENIFHAIASDIDEKIPAGMSWHIELLNQMTLDVEGVRSAIVTKDTARMLEEYLTRILHKQETAKSENPYNN